MYRFTRDKPEAPVSNKRLSIVEVINESAAMIVAVGITSIVGLLVNIQIQQTKLDQGITGLRGDMDEIRNEVRQKMQSVQLQIEKLDDRTRRLEIKDASS
jgi:hypothetical protein